MGHRRQASKRKRRAMQEFHAVHLARLCGRCGAKLKKSTMHHFLCKKCWKAKQKAKMNTLAN